MVLRGTARCPGRAEMSARDVRERRVVNCRHHRLHARQRGARRIGLGIGRASVYREERENGGLNALGCSVQSTRVMMLSAGSSEITSVACAFPDVLMSTILPPARKMSVSPVIPMNFRAPDRQITSWLSGVECCAPNHPEESETGQFSSRPWARPAGTGRPVDHGRATRVRPHSCRIGCRQHRLYTSGGSTWWRPSQPCRYPVRVASGLMYAVSRRRAHRTPTDIGYGEVTCRSAAARQWRRLAPGPPAVDQAMSVQRPTAVARL